jgi:hypothetical protein
MRMSIIDVGMRLGDAIDPCHLANGFEAVIGYECQERSAVSSTGAENQFQGDEDTHTAGPV